MTIKFYCPSCDELIAFEDKHIGKRARCLNCGQRFIIPAQSDQTPQKVEDQTPPLNAEPLPGFYRAVFVDTWKIFTDHGSVTPLVFVAALTCFKFFFAQAICCVNYVTFFVAWALLFGFYLNLIYETAFEMDKLPEIAFGSGGMIYWGIIRPICIFLLNLFIIELPFIIAMALMQSLGLQFYNVWQLELGWRLIPQILFLAGLFFFPIAILTTSVGQDITLLRPDYLLAPIRRAPKPYLVVVALLFAFGILESLTGQYDAAMSPPVNAAMLALNLAVQLIALIAMRAIGLFYRHYNAYMDW